MDKHTTVHFTFTIFTYHKLIFCKYEIYNLLNTNDNGIVINLVWVLDIVYRTTRSKLGCLKTLYCNCTVLYCLLGKGVHNEDTVHT